MFNQPVQQPTSPTETAKSRDKDLGNEIIEKHGNLSNGLIMIESAPDGKKQITVARNVILHTNTPENPKTQEAIRALMQVLNSQFAPKMTNQGNNVYLSENSEEFRVMGENAAAINVNATDGKQITIYNQNKLISPEESIDQINIGDREKIAKYSVEQFIQDIKNFKLNRANVGYLADYFKNTEDTGLDKIGGIYNELKETDLRLEVFKQLEAEGVVSQVSDNLQKEHPEYSEKQINEEAVKTVQKIADGAVGSKFLQHLTWKHDLLLKYFTSAATTQLSLEGAVLNQRSIDERMDKLVAQDREKIPELFNQSANLIPENGYPQTNTYTDRGLADFIGNAITKTYNTNYWRGLPGKIGYTIIKGENGFEIGFALIPDNQKEITKILNNQPPRVAPEIK